MSKPVANLRLFVAVYPPPEMARQLLEMLGGMTLPAHRLTSLDQVHMTLQFIGDTPARELEATVESVTKAAGGLAAFDLIPQALIVLPERGPARLVAAQTDSPPTLLELQRRLAMRLAHHVRRKPADRFRPHLTLCRFKAPARVRIPAKDLSHAPFRVDQIALMRSTLTQAGAQHHAVASVRLL